MNQHKKITWSDIQPHLNSIQPVEGGFSQSKRGILSLPSGERVFVKIGVNENTKKWSRKEIWVYKFLERKGYPHTAKLLAISPDETAFALEAYTADDGWDWSEKNITDDRVEAMLSAMDELAMIKLSESEKQYFLDGATSESDDGWSELYSTPELSRKLFEKLHDIGRDDLVTAIDLRVEQSRSTQFVFAHDTLLTTEERADNCAWNSRTEQVKLVDFNWIQLGDKRIEVSKALTHIQRAGFDVLPKYRNKLDADGLQWLAGFWFRVAAKPIWEGGPAHLRDFQLRSGITAFGLMTHMAS